MNRNEMLKKLRVTEPFLSLIRFSDGAFCNYISPKGCGGFELMDWSDLDSYNFDTPDYTWEQLSETKLKEWVDRFETENFCPLSSISTEILAFEEKLRNAFHAETLSCEGYRAARAHFTIEEWFDVLLRAIDYNPRGFQNWVEKHTMLTRLLPFIEPRINLVELGPKGTGKSFLFRKVGKYGCLVSGGTLSRAKMFFDIAKKQPGLVANNDVVALDEIQFIHFPDPGEWQAALKVYMDTGEATFGDNRVVGSAGIILLGNLPQDDMNIERDMFRSLPEIFRESALLDRFHGFIQGYNIPRMNVKLKSNGLALNTKLFSEIMHLMRDQSENVLYRSVAEDLVSYPAEACVRDSEAILRICTAYLKLLFPHVIKPDMIDIAEFEQYCLRPAVQMRTIIRKQLQFIDPTMYGGNDVAAFTANKKYVK